jgi:hypothetical protein
MSIFDRHRKGRRVQKSAEFMRIDALPRRCPEEIRMSDGSTPELAYSRAYRWNPNAMLFGPQGRALYEMDLHGGMLGGLGLGEGKTLVSLLAPEVLKAKRALLLLPGKLLKKTTKEAQRYAQDWQIANFHEKTGPHRVRSYEWMGRVQNADFLEEFKPDVVIADEAHRLKNRRSAVTRRVMRYIRKHKPKCVFLGASLTTRSLHDYWHLIAVSVPETPMPRMWPEMNDWADAIDDGVPDDLRVQPGALLDWGPDTEWDELKRARLGFQKRLRETPGVIITKDSGCQASLQITLRRIETPAVVVDALEGIRSTWESPSGYAFADTLSLHSYLRQVALGFFYEPTTPAPEEWTDARREWATFVRQTITRSRKFDSELAVALAVRRGDVVDPSESYTRWQSVKDTYTYGTRPVWLSDFAVDAITLSEPTLAWCEHIAIAERIAQRHGVCFFGRMGMSSEGHPIEAHSPHRSAVLSIAANAEGRNLQAWSRNIVMAPLSNAAIFGQLLGRTHRIGQKADVVETEVLITCPEHEDAWQKALENARYLEDTTGQKQKLLLADVIEESR